MNTAIVTIRFWNDVPLDHTERVSKALARYSDWVRGEMTGGHALAWAIPIKLEDVEASGPKAVKATLWVELNDVPPDRYERAVAERLWDALGHPDTGLVGCTYGAFDIEFTGDGLEAYQDFLESSEVDDLA